MNSKEIQSLLEAAKPSIINSLKEELIRSLDYNVKQKAIEEISKFVVDWIKEEVLPEVKKELVESKESLISIGIKSAPEISNLIASELTKALKANLEQSWTRKKILENLFL
jgi:hypothetical protein